MNPPSRPFLRAAGAVAAALCLALPAACAAPVKKPAAAPSAATPTYAESPEAQAFGRELAERRQIDAAWVNAQLARARYLPRIARLIAPPPSGAVKDWAAYRDRFVEPVRIRAGVAFWDAQADWLRRAEQRYGVPPEIVIGILGVETLYGQHMGNFRVLDALATLAFDYPDTGRDRSAFFREELGEYLAMCHAQRLDATQVLGSYAGAIGLPQFMPGSINRHAVDFDGDGHIDLRGSAADAIGSIANFLAQHGWQPGLPTRFPVAPPADDTQRAALLAPDIVPTFAPEAFVARGAALGDAALAVPGKLALVALENGGSAPSYVAGTQNFYVITRYNRSSYYALAVIELGETIAQVRQHVRE